MLWAINDLADLEYLSAVEKDRIEMVKTNLFNEQRDKHKSDAATNKTVDVIMQKESNYNDLIMHFNKKCKNKLNAFEKRSQYLNSYFFRESQAIKKSFNQ